MRRRFSIGLIAAFAALLVAAAPGHAAFGFKELNLTFENEDGSPVLQAGSHPFEMTTTLAVNSSIVPGVGEVPDGETRTLIIDQPEGFVGNPTATPRCASIDFVEIEEGRPACPNSAAVGIASVKVAFTAFQPGETGAYHVPVYNLVPASGAAAKLGFVVLNVPVTIDVRVNEDPPYNVVAALVNVPQAALFYRSEVTLWGYPGDPGHDPYRGSCLEVEDPSKPEPTSLGECPVVGLEEPFLTLPRSCDGPLEAGFRGNSWQDPATFVFGSVLAPGMASCSNLGFSPKTAASPTTDFAESASGLQFAIDADDEGIMSLTGRAQSDIAKVVVTLPEGMTVNPSAAEGLDVCAKAQFEAVSLDNEGCPSASKLGTVDVTTPLLEEALAGSLYIAQQDDPATGESGAENPFNTLLATYLVIRNKKLGIVIRQAGKVEADERTGRLVTTFDDIPEFPLSHVGVHFREGPRSPLVTPPTCGSYETAAVLTPSANPGQPLPTTSTFTIDAGIGGGACPTESVPPFSPAFEAGSISNAAASYTSFYMRLLRADGEQAITKFSTVLPPGVLGKIAGLGRCPDAAIAVAAAKAGRQELAVPSCPAASRIGRVRAGAGLGSSLTYVPGQLYLAGPYHGAPLSVAAVVPAVAGPFDLGTIVTRVGLRLNSSTGEVEVDGAASDPIPHILRGIPLRVRDIRVYADRDHFILNPTSCEESSTRATIFGGGQDPFSSVDDNPFALNSRYQAADCAGLSFKPRLGLRLLGGTKRGGHPALRAVVRTSQGPGGNEANIARAVVRLPHSAFLEQSHIRTICTRVQFAAEQCPKGSVYGRAVAHTPLVDGPLVGPVYLRSSDNELPDMVAALTGPPSAPIEIELVGKIDSSRGGIRSTFASVPDAPVSKFVLDMQGGKKGLLVNSKNLCGSTNRAFVKFKGQNGRIVRDRPVVRPDCKRKKSHKRKSRGR